MRVHLIVLCDHLHQHVVVIDMVLHVLWVIDIVTCARIVIVQVLVILVAAIVLQLPDGTPVLRYGGGSRCQGEESGEHGRPRDHGSQHFRILFRLGFLCPRCGRK